MKKNIALYISIILIATQLKLNAQSIAFSVAKDKNTSSQLGYQLCFACTNEHILGDALYLSKDSLKLKYKNFDVVNLATYNMAYGNYAIVKYERKIDTIIKVSYGFGADTTKVGAMQNAVRNLWSSDWSIWANKDYEIVEEKKFASCEQQVIEYNYEEITTPSEQLLTNFKIQTQKLEKVFNYQAQQIDYKARYYKLPLGHRSVAALELVFVKVPYKNKYSEAKILSASTTDDLEKLIALETFNYPDKYLEQIFIRKMLSINKENNKTSIIPTSDELINKINSYMRSEEKMKKSIRLKYKTVSIGVRG